MRVANLLERELGLTPAASPVDSLLGSIQNPETKLAARLAIMADPTGQTAQRFISEYRRGLQDGISEKVTEERYLSRVSEALQFILDNIKAPFSIGPARKSNAARAVNGAWARKERVGALAVVKHSAPLAFLIQHDWASIFDGTDLDGSEFVLPADQCCFELSVCGMDLCVFLFAEDGEPRQLALVWKTPVGWYLSESYAYNDGVWMDQTGEDCGGEFFDGIDRVIRCACIALDADVIEKVTVHADRAENQRRERRGVAPVNDHVILRIRRTTGGVNVGANTGQRKRLHFRRGHWRRYPTGKSWVRWCMVGDPSLGFRDKDYAL